MYKQSTDSDPEQMRSRVVYQGEMYISEADAKTYFGCDVEYMSGTSYAVCLTGTMKTDVDDKLDQIIDSIN